MSPDRSAQILSRLGLAAERPDELPLGNQDEPLDELFFIILTTMTQYGARQAYADLKMLFPDWNDLLAPIAEMQVRKAIEICGLVNQKAPQLIAIAHRLQDDFGRVTLDPLYEMGDDDTEAYLLSLPRVGKKVARCVMMYSLRRDVLPVDAHVLRVAKRLGLLSSNVSWARAHNTIHDAVEPEFRYAIHVGFVEHGRSVCHHKTPDCAGCSLGSLCHYSANQTSVVLPTPKKRRSPKWNVAN